MSMTEKNIPKLQRNEGNPDVSGSEWDLVVGEVYGYRAWNIDHRGRLISPQQGAVWKPGVNTAFDRKMHMPGGRYDWQPPSGFFAFYDKSSWNGKVHGVIKAHGLINEGTRGFNAEFAEIVGYVDPDRTSVFNVYRRLYKFWEKFFIMRPQTYNLFPRGAAITLGMIALAVLGGFLLSQVLFVLLPFVIGVSILNAINAIAMTNAVSDVDKVCLRDGRSRYDSYRMGLKAELLAGQKVHPLSVLYPDAEVFPSSRAMYRKYNRVVDESRPKPEAPPILSPDDPEFWD